MAFFGTYLEVTPHSRLVWTNDEGGDGGAVTTVTFEEKGGKTLLVMHELYPSKEALDAAGPGMDDGDARDVRAAGRASRRHAHEILSRHCAEQASRKMSKPGNEFTQFVLDQLSGVPALTSAPFFGGIGLRSGASFFGMIMGGTLYFSTSPATREDYRKCGSRCFSYAKQGKVQETKFYEVPAEVFDDAETLRVWAIRAIAASGQKRKAGGSRKSGLK